MIGLPSPAPSIRIGRRQASPDMPVLIRSPPCYRAVRPLRHVLSERPSFVGSRIGPSGRTETPAHGEAPGQVYASQEFTGRMPVRRQCQGRGRRPSTWHIETDRGRPSRASMKCGLELRRCWALIPAASVDRWHIGKPYRRRPGQSADRSRSRPAIGMSGPYCAIGQARRSRPCRSQRSQAISITSSWPTGWWKVMTAPPCGSGKRTQLPRPADTLRTFFRKMREGSC
jgi:hypothetical protein